MADIRPASPGATATTAQSIPKRAGARRIHTRFTSTSRTALDWHDPSAQPRLARVMNGRTSPTNSPDALAMGPDRSDERDRDIVQETLSTQFTVSPAKSPSKLLVIARFDRDGIAWHHLAPFTILQVAATGDHEPLKMKRTPNKVHEQAGGWSWMLHEFDLPPGARQLELSADAVHPKSVSFTLEVWHSDV